MGVGMSVDPCLHLFLMPYSHLPTPQSPNSIDRYVSELPNTPKSPIPTVQAAGPHTTPSTYQTLSAQKFNIDDTHSRGHGSKQCMTPESSPSHGLRLSTPPRIAVPSIRVNDLNVLHSKPTHPSLALDLSLQPTTPLAPSPHISSPVSAPSEHSSRLSSPFIARLSMAERNARIPQTNSSPSSPMSMEVDDIFASSPSAHFPQRESSNISTPPLSPPPHASTSSTPLVGGEIERIRQAIIKDHLAQIREAEIRRPEYFKRSKRSMSDIDHAMLTEERERERAFAVGVTETPHKGRRIQLFQETSEESFEESLMAGGYGPYRTNNWARQPYPTPHIGTSTHGIMDTPLTENEIKKRKRLEAFRSNTTENPRSKLYPVEVEGKGRVLLDVPNEKHLVITETPEVTPSKKRGGGRRKKKSVEAADLPVQAQIPEKIEEPVAPNWPDNEFPWKLRRDERVEVEKALEEERLIWIERFLDRDSDDEDESSSMITHLNKADGEIMLSVRWGQVSENEVDKPPRVRMGRGKMVPLLAHPEDPRRANANKKNVFPSDPADARAALLAKKTVRALAYRNQKRQRDLGADDHIDSVICICNGLDDGRQLVQCDGCETWYHLDCIGIRDLAELGRENDPWFCRSCVTRIRSPSPVRDPLPAFGREPTFVPTDDAPRPERLYDPTLYQPLHNSPLWNPPRIPKTPTRGTSDFGSSLPSSESSKFPSTPQNTSHDIRLYNTPNPFDYQPSNNAELLFDPNSTPSRGLQFGPTYVTPKYNPWSVRTGGLLHTPMRHHSRSSFGRSFGSFDDLGASITGGLTRYHNIGNLEVSPVSRDSAAGKIKRGPQAPLLPRALRPEESPVVRFQPQRDAARLPGL